MFRFFSKLLKYGTDNDTKVTLIHGPDPEITPLYLLKNSFKKWWNNTQESSNAKDSYMVGLGGLFGILGGLIVDLYKKVVKENPSFYILLVIALVILLLLFELIHKKKNGQYRQILFLLFLILILWYFFIFNKV